MTDLSDSWAKVVFFFKFRCLWEKNGYWVGWLAVVLWLLAVSYWLLAMPKAKSPRLLPPESCERCSESQIQALQVTVYP